MKNIYYDNGYVYRSISKSATERRKSRPSFIILEPSSKNIGKDEECKLIVKLINYATKEDSEKIWDVNEKIAIDINGETNEVELYNGIAEFDFLSSENGSYNITAMYQYAESAEVIIHVE